MELLEVMKNIQGSKKTMEELPDNVKGADNVEDIVEKFKDVFEKLYNSAESEKETEEIKTKISALIKTDYITEVLKIDGAKVKEARNLMHAGKSDVTGGFTSDSL